MITSVRLAYLSPVKATLLAASFAASADLESLHSIVSSHPSALSGYTLLRVLLCLPETTDPCLYIPFLKLILSADPISGEERGALDVPTAPPITDPSEHYARRKVDRLPLLPAEDLPNDHRRVISFLLQRSRSIDSETGALTIVQDLLTPFRTELPVIGKYLAGLVEVLSKLVYEHTDEEEGGSIGGLASFETMAVTVGVRTLLNHCRNGESVQGLRTLVIPYLTFKENDPAGWDTIWGWLAEKIQSGDWAGFVEVIRRWDGPLGDEMLREQYARFAIAGCYMCRDTGSWVLEGMRAVQRKLMGLVASCNMGSAVYTAPTIVGDLLDKRNPLTEPNTESLKLLDMLITSAGILSLPLATAVKVKVEGSHDDQKALLVRYIRGGPIWTKRSDEDWRKTRDGVRWLRNKSKIMGKLSSEETEKILLSGMLAATRFELVKEFYVDGHAGALGNEDVERSVLDAFREFYDNASNGNKTRGSMKNALSTLQTIYPSTSKSTALSRAHCLVTATHALSHYSLTLTPGVPLLPVQVRIHPDPASLLARLLDSNPKSYTQADNLIIIAKDLAFGTTGSDGGRQTDARVLGMCVEAALTENDFETAYSFAVNRLVSMAGTTKDTEDVRDVIWRTCFQAGRYTSPYAVIAGENTIHGGKALRVVEMRMELLAQALRVCPPHALADVLAAWRRCEEELRVGLKEDEEEEERHAALWGAGAALGRRTGENEAPMGLFAVARGAAQALRVSAFPLSAVGGGDVYGIDRGGVVEEQVDEHRTRKRDMVSGMVTHGLASGLGWVLGAQPNVPGR